MYGLLGLLIFHWLVAPQRTTAHYEFSFTKAFHCFQRRLPAFIRALSLPPPDLAAWLRTFSADLYPAAAKSTRHKAPSSLDALRLAAL